MRAERRAHIGACAAETHMDTSQEPFCVEIYRKNARPQARKSHFVWKFRGKMPHTLSADGILCAPAQSKRTWTFHKRHFVEIYRKNAGPPCEHLD